MFRRKIQEYEDQCDAFNKEHPVGSSVWWNRGGSYRRSIIASRAFVLAGHTPVIQLEGMRNYVLLDNIYFRMV